jgi:hypothetical protein
MIFSLPKACHTALTELVIVNVYGAQESISRNLFRRLGIDSEAPQKVYMQVLAMKPNMKWRPFPLLSFLILFQISFLNFTLVSGPYFQSWMDLPLFQENRRFKIYKDGRIKGLLSSLHIFKEKLIIWENRDFEENGKKLEMR